MYKKRLNEIIKEVKDGNFSLNVSESTFLEKMDKTDQDEMTSSDQNEISRLWCKI